MLDMSWGEVLVIGAVALIVIGPKDLPKALRTVGNMTAKMRKMASEFQSQFNDAMREAELDEIRKQVSGLNESVASIGTDFNPIEAARDELKSAIEQTPGPSEASSPNDAAADAPAQARGEATSPVAVEGPSVAMPVASVPPVVDPAESVASAVEQGARAEPAGVDLPQEPESEGRRA
jgi:sec-independent protein translocase protein TatB